MYSILYNQARILYRLEPITGLLIKSGKESFDPTRPEMEFIRTWAEIGGTVLEAPFLPGSSIKGIVRSHAERILRTLKLRACDITRDEATCIKRDEKNPSYAKHCLACRTFGDTTLASRFRFTDAFPWKPFDNSAQREAQLEKLHFEQRPGVKIDRRLGTTARGAFYEVETVTAGQFYGEITARNYQLWQLALLALVLRDINEGHQRVGAMKSRGLGRVKMIVDEFSLEQYGDLQSEKIQGVGAVKTLVEQYDLFPEDAIDKPDSLKASGDGLRQNFAPDNGDANVAWQETAVAIMNSQHWKQFLSAKEEQQ